MRSFSAVQSPHKFSRITFHHMFQPSSLPSKKFEKIKKYAEERNTPSPDMIQPQSSFSNFLKKKKDPSNEKARTTASDGIDIDLAKSEKCELKVGNSDSCENPIRKFQIWHPFLCLFL